jgi:hypothetical protein
MKIHCKSPKGQGLESYKMLKFLGNPGLSLTPVQSISSSAVY